MLTSACVDLYVCARECLQCRRVTPRCACPFPPASPHPRPLALSCPGHWSVWQLSQDWRRPRATKRRSKRRTRLAERDDQSCPQYTKYEGEVPLDLCSQSFLRTLLASMFLRALPSIGCRCGLAVFAVPADCCRPKPAGVQQGGHPRPR